MIEFSGLSKIYGSFCALAPLNLTVPRGEMFGFLGPNGAGKTTTIRMMMGILVPSAGTVRIAGLDSHQDGAEGSDVSGQGFLNAGDGEQGQAGGVQDDQRRSGDSTQDRSGQDGEGGAGDGGQRVAGVLDGGGGCCAQQDVSDDAAA